jgi:ABC-type bacteriocin/lantibiotic exporter with double-glycine peptidase domain
LSSLDFIFIVAIFPILNRLSGGEVNKENPFWSHFGDRAESLSFQLFLLFLLILIKNLSVIAITLKSNQIYSKREAFIATRLYVYALKQDLSIRSKRESVDFISIFDNLTNQIFAFVLRPFPIILGDILSLGFTFVGVIFVSLKVSLFLLGFIILTGSLIAYYLGGIQVRLSRVLYTEQRKYSKMKIEGSKIASFMILSHQVGRFEKALRFQASKVTKSTGLRNILNQFPRYLLEINVFILVLFVTLIYGHNPVDFLNFIGLCIAASFRTLPMVSSFINNFTNIRNGLFAVEKFIEVIDPGKRDMIKVMLEENVDASNKSRSQTLEFTGDLILQDVSYRYPETESDVISNLNLRLSAQTTHLINGKSGVGKTTFLHIISGLLSPSEGHVFFLQENKKVSMNSKVSGICFVQQQVPIITGTLAQNICGNSQDLFDRELVLNAAGKAGLSAKIASSPLGIDFECGEDGNFLSAGEKQRIGIARALYTRPKLLILDEPTANLDSATEAGIWETVASLRGSVTIVLVSHRDVPRSVYDTSIQMTQTGMRVENNG